MTNALEPRIRMTSRELIIVVLLVASAVINYVDRANLSMAMPQIEGHCAPTMICSLQQSQWPGRCVRTNVRCDNRDAGARHFTPR